ncbi:amino acid--tRNA ligase-related protein [Hippea alviniae]|uniref:amino acid--tRNA ligase-related protein n=1 Tax=Hippea alviniae TaxID=1279027 RepID=UPI0003B6AFED|nr:amino acid--tRNA ligase-related protein [Hippea alviniae]
MFGRIVKKTANSTLIFSEGKTVKLNFASRHDLGDIIDENDTLLTKCQNRDKLQSLKNERDYYIQKFEIIKRIKEFFFKESFTEVITPKLKKERISETNINLLDTKAGILAPSPEVELKKLLTLGVEKIFELNFAYRDDFEDNLHKKEFLMLEWYRALAEPEDIIFDFSSMVKYLNGSDILKYKGFEIDLNKVSYISYKDAFLYHCNINIEKTESSKLKESFSIEGTDDKLEILDAIFSLKIEKELGKDCIEVIYDFPKERAALSKIKNGYAKRYEIYIAGIELGNCYLEENNFEEIKRRFGFQDREFMEYMAFGMPPASGIAVGIDRLIMILLNKDKIC